MVTSLVVGVDLRHLVVCCLLVFSVWLGDCDPSSGVVAIDIVATLLEGMDCAGINFARKQRTFTTNTTIKMVSSTITPTVTPAAMTTVSLFCCSPPPSGELAPSKGGCRLNCSV